MKMNGTSMTMTGETHLLLRNQILSGEIQPGSKLRTSQLCQQLNVSLSTVREALSQLLAEGLVTAAAHRGWVAAAVSAEDLRDLTRIRIEIETLCLTWSIEAGNLEWETRVIAAAHRLSKTFREHRLGAQVETAWTTAHDEFHLALVSACTSPRLMQIRRQLYEQSERYRKLEMARPPSRDPDAEHNRIVQAALGRDIPKTTRLMRSHLQLTAENILKAMARVKVPVAIDNNKKSPGATVGRKRAGGVPALAR
jgi:DNA-binding GntR family transcriptional regulator